MLQLSNISWSIPGGEHILKDINLTFQDGKLTVITGPNGGGKTTLAKLIAGLEQPASGSILLDGKDITHMDITQRAKNGISYAFQQPVRFKGLTVRDLLELAAGFNLQEADLCTLLSKVGLCARDYMDREINSSLSGGEIKRIEIASVLARRTPLMIFDEPEAGIDLWSFSGLIDVFLDARRNLKGSLIIISHQERILSIADEIIVISGGVVTASGPKSAILPGLLSENDGGCDWCSKGPKKGGN